jgi:hypothetical protein
LRRPKHSVIEVVEPEEEEEEKEEEEEENTYISLYVLCEGVLTD